MLSCVLRLALPFSREQTGKTFSSNFSTKLPKNENMATRTKPAAAVVLGDIILLSTPPPEIECMTTCLS